MSAKRTSRGWVASIAVIGLALAGCTGSTPAQTTTTTPPVSTPPVSTPAGSTTPSGASTSSGSTAATGSTAAPDSGAAADLEQALAELVAMPNGPLGVIAVTQIDDERTVHAVGVADVTTGAAPIVDGHMRIASAAKAFSGATALALVDKGLLSLDDTIGQRLPGQPAAWASVTLRQLLSHTSGLPDFSQSPAFQEAVKVSLEVAPPPSQLLTYVADQPLVFPSGSQYMYDNSDNIAVALMIEAVTGKAYAEALQEQVLQPLGLDETSLPAGIEIAEPTFRGYELEPPNAPNDVTELIAAGWSWASGGIVSTPEDMNDFIRGYVGGELFGPETQAEQTDLFIPGGESGPPGPGVNSASLALFRYQTPCGVVYGHTGNTFGYTQFAVASPDGTRSATVAINVQRSTSGDEPELQVLHALQEAEQAAICTILEGS